MSADGKYRYVSQPGHDSAISVIDLQSAYWWKPSEKELGDVPTRRTQLECIDQCLDTNIAPFSFAP